MVTDDELSRLAEEALLREAQRGAQRAQECGPSGWIKCRLPSTNKTFLQNTLLGAMASNRAKEKQEQTRCERGRRRREQEERDKNTYKRVYLHASTKAPRKPTDHQDAPTNTKKTRKEREKNMFTWTDSGLELGTKKASDDRKDDKGRGKMKTQKTRAQVAVLSRRINFTPSTAKEGVEDKR
ncbi:protein POLR1D-like [Portunus trituberculatus]|uniref:protein POLR1D-like n=1 Tax=Portunus trituberculatus TaxID=210409 RepID=UPI001E1CD904|nr:protein POLR1D-like [Portunus trituberculatus]